jgi:hypothetical protein
MVKEFRFDSRHGEEGFLFSTGSRPALETTASYLMDTGGGGVLPEGKADHTPPSSAEVKNGGAIPPPPPQSSTWRCASLSLVKHRENFFPFFFLLFLVNEHLDAVSADRSVG